MIESKQSITVSSTVLDAAFGISQNPSVLGLDTRIVFEKNVIDFHLILTAR